MNHSTPRSMTARERLWLAGFVVVLIGVAVTWQLSRFFGLELWVPVAGLGGGLLALPWVWFQTRARSSA